MEARGPWEYVANQPSPTEPVTGPACREARVCRETADEMSRASATSTRLRGEIVTLTLVALAAVAWWLTSGLAADMGTDATVDPMADPMAGMAADGVMAMTLGPFLLAWALMMAAMMLPAVTPVVRLYQRAAGAGRVAPTGFFVLGYLIVWVLSGLPAYLLWQQLAMPLAEGATWALRIAGAALLAAGIYQLTPVKRACLRHCRSPMSYFLRLRGSLDRPGGAFRAGLLHAGYCFGCCVALMTVLVVSAAMSLWWALLIALGVFVERNVRWGPEIATGLGVVLLALGTSVLASPPLLSHLI